MSESFSETLRYLILIDVLMNMFTGFFNYGVLVMDKKRIIRNYLKRLIFIDLLVIFPIFFSFEETELSIVSERKGTLYNSKVSVIKLLFVFRLIKLARTFHIIEQILSNNEKIEGLLSLIKLCFKILFTAHLFACIWYFIGDYSKSSGNSSWLDKAFSDYSLKNSDWRSLYLFSLYWSLTTMITVGYGDITPTNPREMGFVILAMIIGCGLFGYCLSNIGIIFEKIFAQEKELR